MTDAGVFLVPIVLPGGPCEFSSVAGGHSFQHVDNSLPRESGFESRLFEEFPPHHWRFFCFKKTQSWSARELML